MTAQQKVYAGAALLTAGSYLMYQGLEGSGLKRPFWAKLLPGG
jgi:hypothetical protein